MGSHIEDCIITDRGGIVENRHMVHAAVVDSKGGLLHAVGNPMRMTLARSAAKPAQALAIIEAGAFDRFAFDDADLALMCASHNSEDRHVSRARAMLAKSQAREEDLRCGAHPALSETVKTQWAKEDVNPTGVHSNCSGKHAGMLAGAKALGAGVTDYHLADHPMQVKVKRVFDELCNVGESEIYWAIDGCNLPAPAFPLQQLAQLYGVLAEAADAVDSGLQLRPRCQKLGRIYNAMSRYPELVAGEGRFCTLLMEAFEGTVVGKLGADGCYGIAVRASEQTRSLGVNGALGISVKIEDGNINILYAAVMEILDQLQIGTQQMRHKLRIFHHPAILNTAGVVTGRVTHTFKVRSVP
ncbi:L-asparaginase II [Aspergillus ambiguus]|uniref:asparaginase n=1 Tax=Aspergillus ambiguus TaxID=176160 RepID=UPI003CCD919F